MKTEIIALLNSENPGHRLAALKQIKLTDTTDHDTALKSIVNDRSTENRVFLCSVLGRRAIADTIILQLANDSAQMVRDAAVQNASTTIRQILRSHVYSQDPKMRLRALDWIETMDGNVPIDILTHLASDQDASVRRHVCAHLQNQTDPLATRLLEKLSRDKSSIIRSMAKAQMKPKSIIPAQAA